MRIMGLKVGMVVGIVVLAGGGLSAASAMAEEGCPNAALRTGFSSALPDCRAYEQVSPAEKEGGSGGVRNGGMRALADGSAVAYSGEPFLDPKSPGGNVYTSVRSAGGWGTVNGDTLSPEEVPTPVAPFAGARVLEETPDGSRVFFTDEEHEPGITSNSTAAPGEPDLYEYDVPSRQLTDLTVDPGGHADVRGILGVGGEGAEEGAYVYFVADGVLTGVSNIRGESASLGDCHLGLSNGVHGCNLYVRHGGETTFIATLATRDEESNESTFTMADWSRAGVRMAEVSSNGRYVAFGSRNALTRQAVDPPEVFRYDEVTGSLVCVSCSPVNVPVPMAVNPRYSAAAINGANRGRYVLNDGRVFFSTMAALVPRDTNGQMDVYEWEEEAPHLISPGTSKNDVALFADASADGSDVFFTTSQSLVPGDLDEIDDLYDAREGGGFPPAAPVGCPVQTQCPGPMVSPPVLGGAPVSATFSGAESPPSVLPSSLVVAPRVLTRSQKLARALKECHAKTGKRMRTVCEKHARRQYGPGSVQSRGKQSATREGR